MKSDKIAKDTITMMVEPISSSFVGHETLDISSLISLKNPATLFAIVLPVKSDQFWILPEAKSAFAR